MDTRTRRSIHSGIQVLYTYMCMGTPRLRIQAVWTSDIECRSSVVAFMVQQFGSEVWGLV